MKARGAQGNLETLAAVAARRMSGGMVIEKETGGFNLTPCGLHAAYMPPVGHLISVLR